ncbi:polyphosphate polymerase domain-containing protein [Marinilactibacillus piezotolerans]|uniref:polyphosphate polymerase domain-containing protein n=1 Tax=Marinilactibacillus piezotolerans TaxID=258723 RepID=UPI0009B04DA2|nr:polyphosphate polymerase domain-containing protein [Marinilactibacillus piezotolerans]
MSKSGVHYRNELKYFVSANSLDVVENRLKNLIHLDPYVDKEKGFYIVKSLYFDDYDDTCLNHNEYSLGRRKKYRIRMYGNNAELIILEKKEKENSMSRKTSCKLSKKQYHALFNGEVERLYWETEDELLKEFSLQIMLKRFTPKVVIKYERTAFIDFPGNVRVTIDRNISCSTQINRFLDSDYTVIPILEKGQHLLEVKYDEFLPDYIKQVIQLDSLEQATFSKYYMGRITSQNHGGI